MPVREQAGSFGLAHACVHMHRPYRQAHTIRLTLTAASVTTQSPSRWHTLCTHRKTHLIHTLPNADTSILASSEHPPS